MARAAKATKTNKQAAAARGPGRAVAAKEPAKVAKTATAPKRPAPAAMAASKVSKEDLRVQVEKLERANAMLRAKSRDAGRSAKVNAARIAELEDQVAQLERQAASEAASAKRRSKPAPAVRAARQDHPVDPGDAVPPGVAVQEPAALDEEAEAAREHLEEHLRPE